MEHPSVFGPSVETLKLNSLVSSERVKKYVKAVHFYESNNIEIIENVNCLFCLMDFIGLWIKPLSISFTQTYLQVI